MPQTHSPQLDYAPKPSLARRRWLRQFAVVLIALLLATVAWRWGRSSLERMRINRLYSRCAAHVMPADKVIFETDYSKQDQHFTGYTPPVWLELNQAATAVTLNSQGTAFLHELRTPSGQRRLVGVDLIILSRSQLVFQPRKFVPGVSILRPPHQVRGLQKDMGLDTAPKGLLSVYAGQLDPSDPSHFTIEYRTDAHTGIIDGWLKDDDTVILEPRPQNP